MQGNLPDGMQSRVLMPSGRGRRSAAAIAAAVTQQTSAPSSSSSTPAPPASDFYNTLASLSAMTASSGSAAADLMRFSSMPYSLGLGSLGLTNPMYAASLASLGILPGMLPPMPGFEGEADKDAKSSGSKEQDRSAADDGDVPTSTLHPSFPYLYNPLIYSQLYAQSLAAATASNFGLPGPFGSLGLGLDTAAEHSVSEESKSEVKTHKSRKPTSTTASSSAAGKETHHPVQTYTEPISHMTVDQPLVRSSYALEALAGGVPDQSEPEDLSVVSKKCRESAADNISLLKPAVSDVAERLSSVDHSHDAVEDLSRKPSVPAVILSVPESRNLVIGTSSSSRLPPSLEKPASASSSAAKDSAVDTGKLLGSGRSRSRLIDSIGTKLMAQKQKVKSDDAETGSLGDVEPPLALTTQLLAEPALSSNTASDNPEQTESPDGVPLVAEKSSLSGAAETDNVEQAPL